ncbi:MAG: hypothetical protein ABMA02_19580 [Saprospiraceae bacterium]
MNKERCVQKIGTFIEQMNLPEATLEQVFYKDTLEWRYGSL